MVKNGFPDYDGMEDEAFPPLPPPQSPGPAGDDGGDPFGNADEEGETSKLADVPAAKRKGVKRPQPKLDSNRLISERGLPALRTLFDDVKFKGKGHEVENLRLLMKKMENWAHRLYPKLQFEDFVEKIEKLGNKKEVQTCLKRIRLDMPLTHEDFTGEEEVRPESNVFGEADPFSGASFHDDELMMPIHSTPAPTALPTPAPPSLTPAPPSMTEEQRRRMELNRQRALERRIARQQQQTNPSSSQPTDSEPSSVSSANLNNSKEQEQQEEVKAQEKEEVVKKVLDDEEQQEEMKKKKKVEEEEMQEEMQEQMQVEEEVKKVKKKKKVQEDEEVKVQEEVQDEEMQEVVNVQEKKEVQEEEKVQEKKEVQEDEEMQVHEEETEVVKEVQMQKDEKKEVQVEEEEEKEVQKEEKEVQEDEEVQPPSSSSITDQPDQL